MIINEESKTTTPALQTESPEQQGSAGPSTSFNTNVSMPAGSRTCTIASLLTINTIPGGPRRKSELKIQIEGVPEGRTHVEVLCFDLVYFTKPAQFVILSAGVFFFYLLYGYYQVPGLVSNANSQITGDICQELIFSLPGFTGYGWYLTLIQFGYYSVFGKVRRDRTSVPVIHCDPPR